MSIDLGEFEQQKERNYGPVPSGSYVLLKMNIVDAGKNAHPKESRVFVSSRTGLHMLSCEFTVASGTYEGVKWRELWMLPVGRQPQNVTMTKGQNTACMISASKMRAVVEAARGVDPSATDSNSRMKRQLNSLMDMDGMTFPARLKVDDGREYEGKTYYNNVVDLIITPDRQQYALVMNGGEDINPNGFTGRTEQKTPASDEGYTDMMNSAPAYPSESDVPF